MAACRNVLCKNDSFRMIRSDRMIIVENLNYRESRGNASDCFLKSNRLISYYVEISVHFNTLSVGIDNIRILLSISAITTLETLTFFHLSDRARVMRLIMTYKVSDCIKNQYKCKTYGLANLSLR